jgi:hypothetical protein
VANKKLTGSNAFLLEDFSTGSVGAAPPNWYYFKSGATPFTITKVDGLEGNWLKLGYGRKISYSFFKSVLPQNFKLEFDVATDKDFGSRTGGSMEIILNTEKLNQTYQNQEERLTTNGTVMKITVASGNAADLENNNFRGLLKVSINSSPAVNRENFEEGITTEKPLTDFTSKKNKVHIEVVVKEGKLSIYSNGNLIIQPADFKMRYGSPCILCGIPTGRQFAALTLNNTSNNPIETGVYFSNLKITKD